MLMLVLLVEDEPLIREDIRYLLEAAGHEVLVAADGVEAMDTLDCEGARIDALVTDIKLPCGPDGWRIASRARVLSPHMLVIYITGAAEHEWGLQAVNSGRMLQKPFGSHQVVAALAELQAAWASLMQRRRLKTRTPHGWRWSAYAPG